RLAPHIRPKRNLMARLAEIRPRRMTFLAGRADVGHVLLLRRRQRGNPIRCRQQRQIQLIPFAVEIGIDDSAIELGLRPLSPEAALGCCAPSDERDDKSTSESPQRFHRSRSPRQRFRSTVKRPLYFESIVASNFEGMTPSTMKDRGFSLPSPP